MKRFLLLLFFAFTGISGKAQNHRMQQEIRCILEEQTAAWNRGDLEGYMKAGYQQDDSLLFLGKSGATYGFDSTLARYRRGYKDAAAMGQLRFDILRMTPLGKRAAYVAGRWHLSRNENPVSGAFLLVFRKTRAGWRIVADHSS